MPVGEKGDMRVRGKKSQGRFLGAKGAEAGTGAGTYLEDEGGDPDPGGLCGVVAAAWGGLVGRGAGELVEDGVEEDEGRADEGHGGRREQWRGREREEKDGRPWL